MGRFARAAGRHHRSEIRGEGGFTIVETMVALGVVFAVVLGLLASLNTGIKGVLTGRQRTGATAVAKEVLERARAVPYETVGHDTSSPDPTLSGDSRLTFDAASGQYRFVPEGQSQPEPLVAVANPHFPLHQWSQERDGSTYDVTVYVTEVAPLVGDDYKRLTVFVAYSPAQYPTSALVNVVKLSSFLAPGGVPTCPVDSCQQLALPELRGAADADAGSVTVSGTLAGVDLSRAEMLLPLASASVSSKQDGLRETFGLARSVRGTLSLTSGTSTANGVKAETVADNDGGTPAGVRTVDGPHAASAGETLSAGDSIAVETGGVSEVVSKSAAASCPACAPPVGSDSDGLVYGWNRAVGPGSGAEDAAAVVSYRAGILGGHLAAVHGAASTTTQVDSDPVSNSEVMRSAAEVGWPAVDLVTFLPDLGLALPTGFQAAARVSATEVVAEAEAGPTAAPPAVSGDTVSVQAWQSGVAGLGGYTTITVVPGQQINETVTGGLTVVGPTGATAAVALTTTVRSGRASTSQQVNDTIMVSEEASLTNWLSVEVRLQAVEAGVTTADVTVHLEYGQVTAEAEWSPT